MDRRRSYRYDVAAQVKFNWKDAEGVCHRDEGLVHDISQSGMFVLTNSHPPIGTTVRFQIFLQSAAAARVRVEAQGQIIRLERSDPSHARCGLAVATNVMKVFDRTLYVVENDN